MPKHRAEESNRIEGGTSVAHPMSGCATATSINGPSMMAEAPLPDDVGIPPTKLHER
jgi:hypothetical protein